MEWPNPDYTRPQYYVVPPPPPGWPGQHHPVQGYEQPVLASYYPSYELPVSSPPIGRQRRRTAQPIVIERSHGRHRQHHGQPHPPSHRRATLASHNAYDDEGSQNNEIWSDASVGSDISDTLSATSFSFDASVSEQSEKQSDEPLSFSLQSKDEFVNPVNANQPKRPSPYTVTELYISSSTFNGDIFAQWNCTAQLSTRDPMRKGKALEQPLFRWMCVSKSVFSNGY
ncbi:MAG: hypothetical protein Q9218_008198 [Villophora microphyllina]